jgi:hypothetical protein
MDDPSDPGAAPWSGSRSSKERNAVQRAVTALLNELAPEKVLGRVAPVAGRIEEHRTPTGCVLQAGSAALSVSWFAPAGSDTAAGELHIVVWSGRVSRRGAAAPRNRATIASEQVFLPIDRTANDCQWQAADGTKYDTKALAEHCIALLEAQIKATPG